MVLSEYNAYRDICFFQAHWAVLGHWWSGQADPRVDRGCRLAHDPQGEVHQYWNQTSKRCPSLRTSRHWKDLDGSCMCRSDQVYVPQIGWTTTCSGKINIVWMCTQPLDIHYFCNCPQVWTNYIKTSNIVFFNGDPQSRHVHILNAQKLGGFETVLILNSSR